MKAIQIQQHGGPEVLQVVDVESPEPESNEVCVRVAAAGVNFIEIYQRNGLYPVNLPFILGQEGAGIVERVGVNVKDFRPGDRVAYASVPGGSYAASNCVPASRLVTVPEAISLKHAAAVMLQGMTAHYLARTTFPLREGQTCLIQAVAGGVGLLLCQIAKMQGAIVIGTTSSESKAELARSVGADHIINYSHEPVAERVREITDGAGVHVVYDSVGKSTFQGSIDSLRRRGMLVSFGQSSGAVPPFEPLLLSRKGSLFLTRPTLGHYIADRTELEERAQDVFGWMIDGKLKVRIDSEFTLDFAADAHRALESRKTAGKVLIVP